MVELPLGREDGGLLYPIVYLFIMSSLSDMLIFAKGIHEGRVGGRMMDDS